MTSAPIMELLALYKTVVSNAMVSHYTNTTHTHTLNANQRIITHHSMSVVNALTQFVNSLIGIVVSLCNSVFAVFYAIFALGADVVQSTFLVVKHLVAMFLDLFSGVLGFITGTSKFDAMTLMLMTLNCSQLCGDCCARRGVLCLCAVPAAESGSHQD